MSYFKPFNLQSSADGGHSHEISFGLLWSLVVMIVFGCGQRLSFLCLLTEWVQKFIAVQGSPSLLANKVRS